MIGDHCIGPYAEEVVYDLLIELLTRLLQLPALQSKNCHLQGSAVFVVVE